MVFRADSCESKCGTAPEVTGITALDAQIKYLNWLIEHFRRAPVICKQSKYKEDEASKKRNAAEQMEPRFSLKCISRTDMNASVLGKKTSLYSAAAVPVRGLVVPLLMGSAVQHVAFKVLA